jgi:hypothetical protein
VLDECNDRVAARAKLPHQQLHVGVIARVHSDVDIARETYLARTDTPNPPTTA